MGCKDYIYTKSGNQLVLLTLESTERAGDYKKIALCAFIYDQPLSIKRQA